MLKTQYLGLELAHPLVASASPLTKTLAGIRALEDGGVSAIVMHSLFEEQIEYESHSLDHYFGYQAESYAEALSYFPDLGHYNLSSDEYLNLIQKAKAAVNVPIIASLNGISPGGWTEYARQIQQAGADGLELNLYYIAANPELSATEVEDSLLSVVREVRASITIPLAVKIGPYFTALGHTAHQIAAAGAQALVLFNRFYQPDFDLETLQTTPHLNLSTPADLRLPLRWVAILYGRVSAQLALSGGVHSGLEAAKALLAGAQVVMTTSELLQKGPDRAREMVSELSDWLQTNEYASVDQLRGSLSQQNSPDPAAFERAGYMKVLASWSPEPTSSLPQG
jgi:dihydroorotate dehydrogenase (fumarate)